MRPDSRGTIFACIALLLMAAAPETPTSEVQKVPPEQALAVLGHMVADPEGKDIGRLVDVLVDREGQPQAGVIDFGASWASAVAKLPCAGTCCTSCPAIRSIR